MGSPGSEESFDNAEVDRFLDDRLRAEFGRTFPTRPASFEAFDELIPAFGRARRVRQAKQTVLGVAVAALLLGGVGLGASQLADRDSQGLTYAGQSESEPPEVQPDPLEVTGTTAAGPDPSTAAVDDPDSADRSDQADPGSTSTPSSSASPSSTEGRTTTAPSTTETSSTVSQTTAATGPGSTSTTLIESDCGGVAVSVSGQDVLLLESLPASGYSADEKSAGPESVEVSLEGRDGHCEVKAEVSGGRLDVETD